MFKKALINLVKNWKTTLTGLAAIITAVTTLETWEQKLVGVIAGIGLMSAKDGSVTGTANNPRAVVDEANQEKMPQEILPKK